MSGLGAMFGCLCRGVRRRALALLALALGAGFGVVLLVPGYSGARSAPPPSPAPATSAQYTLKFDSRLVQHYSCSGSSTDESCGTWTMEYTATVPLGADSGGIVSGSAEGSYAQASGTITYTDFDATCNSNVTNTTTVAGGNPAEFQASFAPGSTGGGSVTVTDGSSGSFPTENWDITVSNHACGLNQDVQEPEWLGDFSQIHQANSVANSLYQFQFPLTPGSGDTAGTYKSDQTITPKWSGASPNETITETTTISVTGGACALHTSSRDGQTGSASLARRSANSSSSPRICGITPETSGPHGGGRITIHGSGFGSPGSADTVVFRPSRGGPPVKATDVHVISGSEIKAIIPAANCDIFDSNGAADLQVVTAPPAGGASNKVYFYYEVRITSFSPAISGPDGGGPITMTGTGFGPEGSADKVDFVATDFDLNNTYLGKSADVKATDVHVVSDTEITATIPAAYDWTQYLHDDADLVVTAPRPPGCTKGGVSSNNPSFHYRVSITRLSPNTSRPEGGGTISIAGFGFGSRGSDDTVFFNSAGGGDERPLEAKDVHVVSETEITAIIPAESTSISKAGGLADVKIETKSPVWFSVISRGSRFTYPSR
jgi:hypothetical protein